MSCTLPRAPAVRALPDGSEGNLQSSSSGCWPPRLSASRRAPGSQGPWLGSAAAHTQRLTPWEPSKCMTDVGFLALSSPAETCAGGSGLILRVWVPAHNPNSVETAPESKPAGGALSPRLNSECTASREVRLLGEEEAAQLHQAESSACQGLREPPVQQSSRSSQKPHLAEFLSRGCSAKGETCPDLPCF